MEDVEPDIEPDIETDTDDDDDQDEVEPPVTRIEEDIAIPDGEAPER